MKMPSLLAAIVVATSSTVAFAQATTSPATPAAAAATAPAVGGTSVTIAPETDGRGARFRAACGGDVAKHCADQKLPDGATTEQKKAQRGKVRACLASHEKDLAPDCKAALSAREAAAAAKKG